HETVERFLRLLGSDNPLEEAELVEHTLSASTVAALGVLSDFFTQSAETMQKYAAFRDEATAKSHCR
ncbi:MAG TPA: hypothetical protein VN369_04090, partial [Terriglobales bacterium]|nr:hypothetical protein [Terriglobales bacterium]